MINQLQSEPRGAVFVGETGGNDGSLLTIWRTAALVRAADEALRELIATGQWLGFYYSPRGQEVISATVASCLRRDDYLVTTYRGIHDQLAKGVPLLDLFAEMFGKRTGACKGKGGPMHVADPSVGVMVTTGIVGAGLPIAAGLALGARLEGSDRVCAVSFGDGATNIGAFHEALNLAAVWDLPVVFVCQNNEFGEFTPRAETQRGEIADRAAAYGIPGVAVDGNDATALRPIVAAAVARARAGGGPTLLDCRTYRFMGHFFGDQMSYMDKDEITRRMADDPVDRLRAAVLAAGEADEDGLRQEDAAIAAEIAAALDAARSAPDPEPDEVLDDVWATVGP
jgi:TPP-dependent pyruvate/acetoin dehydrogenase alpha subunit